MASGSFENLIYDTGTYNVDLKQSTAPLEWVLDPNFANNCNTCLPANSVGYIARQGVSIDKVHPLIDVESDLKLLNFRNSRNPQDKYSPPTHCVTDNFHFGDCNLFTDYSRITFPVCETRGTPAANRYQPLCLNPQDVNRWLQPSEIGINYRMVVKDNHTPCIPCPISQTAVLPCPENKPVIDCKCPMDYLCPRYTFGSPLYNSYYREPSKCVQNE
jgi:hypothetical protein